MLVVTRLITLSEFILIFDLYANYPLWVKKYIPRGSESKLFLKKINSAVATTLRLVPDNTHQRQTPRFPPT